MNVSPLQFGRQSDFVDQVRRALARSGLQPACLQLGLTEGTVMVDSEQSLAVLSEDFARRCLAGTVAAA